MTWLLLITAILLEVIATLSLKASYGFTRRHWIAPVIIGYVGAFTILGIILSIGEMAVGIVYSIWAASGIALTAIFGRMLFKDLLTRKMITGIGFIIVGVVIIEWSSAV
jgi:small multidrug resistance pump